MTPGSNEVTGVTADGDNIKGLDGDDTIFGDAGADTINGDAGADQIFGEGGDDVATVDATLGGLGDGADAIDLGGGFDRVQVVADEPTNVRLTFTSAEVGNGSANDSGALANQDGGLAVRLQSEALGTPLGDVDRLDDEGITFVGDAGVTFDVRDLVSGAARGEAFEVVTLGTSAGEYLSAVQASRPYYINAGQGFDTIKGEDGDDFLVGGGGDDKLVGDIGDDSFIGGLGADVIRGGDGDDVTTYNVLTDECDRVNLDAGNDVVNVNTAAGATTNVRLTFTSSEVGNGSALESGMLANQDGLFPVLMRAEDGSGVQTGDRSRYDDEGITFVGGAGVTFDVRDLVTGAARGEAFEVVTLGTQASERLVALQEARPYYINAGQGLDTVVGGTANDFLVGGAGNDTLNGAEGDDSLLGGGGGDVLRGGEGDDTVIYNVSTDGSDRMNLDAGDDVVNVNANAATNVRLTFTSAEVGNDAALDSGMLANQDGGFAVRMRAENGSDQQIGSLSRYDDEGITFNGGVGVTFDVRDLVSGAARGQAFEVVTLGTSVGQTIDESGEDRAYYIKAGMGDDTVTGGAVRDFLVGGGGADLLDGQDGHDSMIGGGGADAFAFTTAFGAVEVNIDSILDFNVADDTVQLDSAVFTGLAAGGLSADAFNTGTAASDASDRIIYDSAGGRLLFDRDGSGTDFAAIRFSNIGTGLALTENDFVVV